MGPKGRSAAWPAEEGSRRLFAAKYVLAQNKGVKTCQINVTYMSSSCYNSTAFAYIGMCKFTLENKGIIASFVCPEQQPNISS